MSLLTPDIKTVSLEMNKIYCTLGENRINEDFALVHSKVIQTDLSAKESEGWMLEKPKELPCLEE